MDNVCKVPFGEVQRMIRRRDQLRLKKNAAVKKKLAYEMKPIINKLLKL